MSHRERRALLVKESRFVLIAVPPLLLLLVLAAAGLSYSRAIQAIVIAGVLSLGFIPLRVIAADLVANTVNPERFN